MRARAGHAPSWTISATVLCTALLIRPAGAATQSFPVASDLPAESRQFDFWVGEWDVNLRVLQDDLTWLDARTANAHIFPILAGKAVLELWDEAQIKGMSLRFFDPETEKWVLWLNWPGPNRSGSNSLEGSFRHGRGEFFSYGQTPDGDQRVTRYTFSDITPTSLRWDDAFSDDGGRTWTHGWIMEWTRTAAQPALPDEGGPAHTFVNGERCTLPMFRSYEALAGKRAGTLAGERLDLRGYRVLDGCALILLAGEPAEEEWFGMITLNTYAQRLELLELDAEPDTPARVYYGPADSDEMLLHQGRTGGQPRRRVRLDIGEDGSLGIVWETRETVDDAWTVAREGRFGR